MYNINKKQEWNMTFKDWVDEFFFNSIVDLEILRKAYNAISSKEMHVSSLDDIQDNDDFQDNND